MAGEVRRTGFDVDTEGELGLQRMFIDIEDLEPNTVMTSILEQFAKSEERVNGQIQLQLRPTYWATIVMML